MGGGGARLQPWGEDRGSGGAGGEQHLAPASPAAGTKAGQCRGSAGSPRAGGGSTDCPHPIPSHPNPIPTPMPIPTLWAGGWGAARPLGGGGPCWSGSISPPTQLPVEPLPMLLTQTTPAGLLRGAGAEPRTRTPKPTPSNPHPTPSNPHPGFHTPPQTCPSKISASKPAPQPHPEVGDPMGPSAMFPGKGVPSYPWMWGAGWVLSPALRPQCPSPRLPCPRVWVGSWP